MKKPSLLMGLIAGAGLVLTAAEPASSLYDIPLKDINGKATSLRAYEGKVLLIVNVASKCGFTKQYKGLEELHRKHKDQGLVVLGFPCNQFGGQEPGTNEEIVKFCTSKFDVTFPMFNKLEVKGPGQHALYAALSGPKSPFPGEVKWNFGKFLVGRDGKLIARYDSRVAPEGEELTQAVETALKQK
jgi:glutathione peroxidase